MLEFLARNRNTLILFLVWYLVGRFSTPVFFILGLASIVLFWRKEMYFEIFIGFFFILILSDSLSAATDFAKVFKNVYILVLTAIVVLDRKKFAPLNRIYIYFLPFILIALISLVKSPEPFLSLQKALSYVLLIFVVPQFLIQSYRLHGERAVRDFLFFGTAMILVGFSIEIFEPGYTFARGGRFRGVFGNPNGLGIFTSLILALVYLAREYFPGKFSKSDLRWLVIPALISLVLTGSRTSIIAVALFLAFTRIYRLSPFLGFVAFFVLAIGAELIAVNSVFLIQSLGLGDFFRIDTLEGGSGREVAWNFAWNAIQENFWIGRGFAFDEWLMTLNQDLLNDLGHQGGVHNTYLQIWLNTGIVGLLLFLRAIFLNVIEGAKNTRLAFPFLWLVLFSILPESWLAASLNPFSILFFAGLTMITDPEFQADENLAPADTGIELETAA